MGCLKGLFIADGLVVKAFVGGGGIADGRLLTAVLAVRGGGAGILTVGAAVVAGLRTVFTGAGGGGGTLLLTEGLVVSGGGGAILVIGAARPAGLACVTTG
ncbi:MAG: hypothetical protein WC980_04770 [Candidatus Brocadiia bacterium]